MAPSATPAERRRDALVAVPAAPPAASPAGRDVQRQVKAWRATLFVCRTHRAVPPPRRAAHP